MEASAEVIDGRHDHQLGHVGPRVQLDQEPDRRGDVLGLQDHRAALGSDRNRPGVQDRRFDLARVDHRRANAVRPFLSSQADAQGRLAELRGRVAGASQRAGPQSRNRADLDHQPVLPPAHRRQHMVDQVERAGEIGGDHPIPVGGIERLEAAVPDVGAGVADQDVDRSEGGLDLVDDRLDRRPIGDVARCDEGRVPALVEISPACVRVSRGRGPTSATRRPISASVAAMLRPIPLPAPVTSAVFKFAAKASSSRAIHDREARIAPCRATRAGFAASIT